MCDSLGSLDVMHRVLRIREVQIVRPIVEGPDKGPKLREVSLKHPDDPSAVSGVEGVLDIGADVDHRGRPKLVEAVCEPTNAGHNVTAQRSTLATTSPPEGVELPCCQIFTCLRRGSLKQKEMNL